MFINSQMLEGSTHYLLKAEFAVTMYKMAQASDVSV